MAAGDRPRALVAGAGLIGRSVAYGLAQRGFWVRLIDPRPEASLTTRGSLGVLTHANGGDGPLSALYRDSHQGYRAFAEQLRAATGMDIGWRAPGGLDVILDEADQAEAAETLQHNQARGCPVELLDGAEARRREPALRPEVRGALFFPDDHRVDPERLSRALAAALLGLGGILAVPEGLEEVVECTPAGVRARTDRGCLDVDYLVLAAGAWTAALAARLGAVVPVRPVRGQHVRVPGPGPHLILRHGGRHLVPVADGTVVGATVEEVGFDAGTTDEARLAFTQAWRRVLGTEPCLGEGRAGLRPKPKGARPLLGPLAEFPRVFVATGHYKNGVLMGPLTGQLVADWMATGCPPRDLSYFCPER